MTKTFLSFAVGIFCLLNFTDIYSQHADTSKYKRIESIYYDLDSNIINILNDSFVFNGFMVFKLDKNNQNLYSNPQNDGLITLESYWLENLTNFEETRKDFYLMSNYLMYNYFV